MYSTPPSPANQDVDALLLRARNRRRQFSQESGSPRVPQRLTRYLRAAPTSFRSVPQRYILHLVVGMLVPLAAAISAAPIAFGPATSQQPVGGWHIAEEHAAFTFPLAPLSIDTTAAEDQLVPNSAFAEIDALPVSAFNPAQLRVQPVPATVIAEKANVRGGPGIEYDRVTTLTSGAPLLLLARYGDWYKAQASDGQVIWLAAELLDTDSVAAEFLPEATSIPAPPPPKIAQVFEEGLNLRDGPSTVYVGMLKLPAGIQLDLLARYQDWFQVQTPEGQIGWVTAEYLQIGPGVAERVEVVTQIPDPNPALVGIVRESQVNLRGGPGTPYDKLGVLGTNVQIELLARHKDWFKVRTPRGTEGWVSNELVDVSQFVTRRVPFARTIPSLPQAAPRVRDSAGIRRPIQFAPASATSGPAQFALQFVGSRYVWGGASPESGFDCSGFTQYVYAQFGLSLPHSSAGQFSTSYGAAISDPANLQPGDIVFFVNTYKRGISHVGIYIGGGDVVQALTPGRGVGVANLNQQYWSSRYYGAIRPSQ